MPSYPKIYHWLGEVPASLSVRAISSIYIEFLQAGHINRLPTGEYLSEGDLGRKCKNHVIVRFVFQEEIKEGIHGAAPKNTKAMRLTVEPEWDPENPPNTYVGHAMVRTQNYSIASRNALLEIPLPLGRPDITLGDLLDPAIAKNMNHFHLVDDGRGVMGCRDWT
jgi:hypothetical protein